MTICNFQRLWKGSFYSIFDCNIIKMYPLNVLFELQMVMHCNVDLANSLLFD